MPNVYARPVIPLMGCLIAGIAGGVWLPGGDGIWLYFFIAFNAVSIILSLIRKKSASLSPLLLFLSLGYLSIQPWIAPDFPAHHMTRFIGPQKWQMTGIVDVPPIQKNDALKFILEAETLGADEGVRPVTGKIRVTVSGDAPGFTIGDRVRFTGRIKSIRNFNNPGGFNYSRYMAFKGVRATTYVRGNRFSVLEREQKNGFERRIAHSRKTISAHIEKTLSGDHKQVLKALITGGGRSQIPPALSDAFNRAGIGHLLAISGLHIGIVATMSFLFFSWLLSRFNTLLWRAWTRKGAAVLTVFPVLVYGFLAGMSPSTQRAVVMTGVFLFTFLFEREQDVLNTLATAALLILVIFPPALFSISFQLSFAAVFFIIYGLSKTRERQDVEKSWTIRAYRKIFLFLKVSVFAILGTLPLVMLYFNQTSLVGLLSNCILVPMIGFVVVPLGLAAVFMYPVSSFVSAIGIWAAGVVLAAAVDIVTWISELPLAAVKTVTPSLFEVGCFYILFLAALNLKKKPVLEIKQKTPFPAYKVARAVAGVVLVALAVDTGYWLHERFWHRDLRVTMIDVGQGNAALLELPGGYNVLIDGGGFSNNQVFDVGAWVLAPFLWQKKIKTVDTLILSHANSDHLNGLTYIARHFNVKNIWSNNEMSNTRSCEAFLQVIREKDIVYPAFSSIPKSQTISGVDFDILYPPDGFMEKKEIEKWRDSNNNSLVVKVTFGSTSFFFPGDIMAAAELELVRTFSADLKSVVLLAPHHGSRTSSTELFLDRVDPEIVVISLGWKNRFRMPHVSVLERYKTRNCDIYRTDLHGALMMVSDGQDVRVEPTIMTQSRVSESG